MVHTRPQASPRPGRVTAQDADERRVAEIAGHVRAILHVLGVDPADPHVIDTPERVAEMYLELLPGVTTPVLPGLSTFPSSGGSADLVSVRDVPFYSLCAHHLLPFFGQAHVTYLPAERIIGLGSIADVVDHFARRPQVQERLTDQVLASLVQALAPVGALVVLRARHLCTEMRGPRRTSVLTTSAAHGVLAGPAARDVFLRLAADG